MIGKILGGVAGAKAAKGSRGVGKPRGALMGMASVALLRRMSLPVLVAAAAGGYVLKKRNDKRASEQAKRKSFETPPAGAAA